MPDDVWKLISTLCREVVENQNVFLEINVLPTGMLVSLYPYDDDGRMKKSEDGKDEP